MQNKNGFFGGFALILTLGLAACGGAEGTSGGESPHPQILTGQWRANAPVDHYAEDFELRDDGTATLTRRVEGRSDVATYACTWSVYAAALATPDDPWILERACQRVSITADAVGFELDFVDALSVVRVERSVFVAVPADQTTLKYYARARAAE